MSTERATATKPRHAKSRQRHVRSRNAAQIRDDQERFGTLCEVSTDLIYELDSKGRYVYLSPSHETLGYQRGLLLGKKHSELIYPEDRAAVNTDIQTSIDTGTSLRSLFRIRTNDGQWRWLDASGRPFSCALSQDTRLVLIARDITAQKTMEDRLLFLASHDQLTSLYNGRGLVEALLEAIEEAKAGKPSALLLIDLDNFKVVNDVYEHATGDRLIVAIAGLLHRTVAARGLVARPRGDEFFVLLRSECVEKQLEIAREIQTEIEQFFFFVDSGRSLSIKASISIVPIDGTSTSREVVSRAGATCLLAKSRGRNRVEVFEPTNREIDSLRTGPKWSLRILEGIQGERFELWYQPILSVATNEILHHEVLIRLREPSGEIILPTAFMAAAERFGSIQDLDRYVIRAAIRQLSRNPGVTLSVNVSGASFKNSGLNPFIIAALQEEKVSPHRLVFEITETALISNLGQATNMIAELRNLGVRSSLDDFGSGFSSLRYLKELDFDFLKIDGAFIRGIESSPSDQIIVRSIIDFARLLGKQTIAEFVHNENTLRIVRSMGVDCVQGDFLGKASPHLPSCRSSAAE